MFSIVAADVKALYPSLYRNTVIKALECALEKHSNYSAEARKIIVELNKICLNNVVTQYGDQFRYSSEVKHVSTKSAHFRNGKLQSQT